MILLSRRSLLAIAAVVDIALHARPSPVAAKLLAARHAQASAAFLAALDTVTVEELCQRAQAKAVFGGPDAKADFTI